MEKLSCQELVELVTDYLEEALSSEERRRFEQHLHDCGGCLTYLDQARTTIEVVGRLSPEALSPEAEHALLEAFRDWKSSQRRTWP